MSFPIIGDVAVQVHQVKPYAIHGDLYYQLIVTRVDDAASEMGSIAVPQHAAQSPPQPGDRLTVTFLMGQVTAIAPMANI
jgi:hypothetical protein